jgi:hypothetical protein
MANDHHNINRDDLPSQRRNERECECAWYGPPPRRAIQRATLDARAGSRASARAMCTGSQRAIRRQRCRRLLTQGAEEPRARELSRSWHRGMADASALDRGGRTLARDPYEQRRVTSDALVAEENRAHAVSPAAQYDPPASGCNGQVAAGLVAAGLVAAGLGATQRSSGRERGTHVFGPNFSGGWRRHILRGFHESERPS